MTKYEYISKLSDETVLRISKDGTAWMKYLDTAARLYKYPFEDQMLIYAQRPDATACAVMQIWNEKMSCWVKRGAKGIALIDRESEYPRLKYVFDVSDVRKAKDSGKFPYLWEMREEHKGTVITQLEKTYGPTDSSRSFEDRLIELAGRIAKDSYMELIQDISHAKEGGFLGEPDEPDVEMRFRETLFASIAYTLLSRCGADMDLYRNELKFDYISEFHTTMALSMLGNATTNLCKPMLMEIGKTIAAYDCQAVRQRDLNKENEEVNTTADNGGKKPEKVLANKQQTRYNALKRESKMQNETTANQTETEGNAHGTDIREERGLYDTQPDTGQRAGGAADQVRTDAQELSDGTPERDLQRASADGRTERALSKDTEAGRGEDGLSDGADGENRGSGRGAESVRSDEMGCKDEQHQTLGGGKRTEGSGLQSLNSGLQQNMETGKPDNDRNSGEDSLSGSFLNNPDSAEKAGYKNLKSGNRISINGQECVKTDEWKSGDDVYVLGNSVEDSDFFYAEINGNTRFEYDHKPDREEIEDDFIDMEAMRDIDRHEAEVFPRFEGGAEPGFYYAISLISDAFTDSYYISVMDGSTGEEIQGYRDSHGDMPTFGTVDEAVDYCHRNDIDYENAAEVDQWRIIDVERKNDIDHQGQNEQEPETPGHDVQRSETRKYPEQAEKQTDRNESDAKKALAADDIQNLVLTCREYSAGSRTAVYQFECDIRGEHDSMQYTLEYHDDGECFTIHTERDDIWERMPEPELERLEGILRRETVYFKYYEKIASAESLEALKDIEYEIMEDESPYFPAVSERVWKAFSQKKDGLSVPDPHITKKSMNFHITDDSAGIDAAEADTGFSPKEKFRKNIEALRTLEKIEGENRTATPEEQKILSQYVGWGGLADAFDESKSAWAGEYQELKSLLSDSEYASARESTLNAHYTSPAIIRSIYKALENMGFENGNILDEAVA